MKKINIAILGLGTIGTGVAKLIIEQKSVLKKKLGAELFLKYVVDVDTKTDRGVDLKDTIFTDDAKKVFNDADVDIVVETIGGTTIAKDLVLEAIKNKKNIVTANKALICYYGDLIFEKAAEQGVDVFFEASVGGCIPVIKTLRESLVSDEIISMKGILNGTCNYILSEITEKNVSFKEALKDAQKKGYAERDPHLDISGGDSAHKIVILSAIAYGLKLNFKDIYTEGISNLNNIDVELAHKFGYIIKLLAICRKTKNGKIDIRVHPALVKSDSLLANVRSSFNAINIESVATGDIFLYGYGAGMKPTATAVLGDISDIARNIILNVNKRVPYNSYKRKYLKDVELSDIKDIKTNYYIRLMAEDKPNVLSKIAGILGENSISIKSVHQEGRNRVKSVPIIMFTHTAKESDIQDAIKKISTLSFIKEYPVIIRIEGESD